MKKKILASLLTLVMVLMMTPLTVFADGETGGTAGGTDKVIIKIKFLSKTDSSEITDISVKPDSGNSFPTFAIYERTEGEEKVGELLAEAQYSKDGGGVEFEISALNLEGAGDQEKTYWLREVEGPAGYQLSRDLVKITIKKDTGGTGYSVSYADINDTTKNSAEFQHNESSNVKIAVPVKKTVSAGAPAASFKAKLSVVGKTSGVIWKNYEAELKIGDSLLEFEIEEADTDTNELYLEEIDMGVANWEYSTAVYNVKSDGSTTADGAILYSDIYIASKKDGKYSTEVDPTTGNPGTALSAAEFVNTYTGASSGGGGSHTRYYEVKVNNGKALNFLGDGVTRASSGTVLKAEADPAPEGKVFKGWEVVKGGINAENVQSFDFTMPREDVELTAVYEDKPTEIIDTDDPKEPTKPNQDSSIDTEEPTDTEEPSDTQQPSKETSVPKTGDTMTMELMLFAVLAAGAAFGMRKAYHKTK